jgi:hypothetical protein
VNSEFVNEITKRMCINFNSCTVKRKRNPPEILQQFQVFSGSPEETLQPAQLLPCILFEQTIHGIFVQPTGAIKNVKKTHTP